MTGVGADRERAQGFGTGRDGSRTGYERLEHGVNLAGPDADFARDRAVKQAIPVFVINLARRPDRLERLGGRLAALGIAFERVDALDLEVATDVEIDAVIRASGPLGPLGRGDRVCAVSHARAWQRLIDAGAPFGLVLEDDVYLADDAGDLVRASGWIPAGVDVVKLEKFGTEASGILLGDAIGEVAGGARRLHRMHSRHVGGAAYILSRRAAAEGLALRGSVDVPVDHLLFNPNASRLSRRLKPVVVRPAVATQRHYGYNSDVDTTRKAVKPRGWRGWRHRLRRVAGEVGLAPLQAALLLTGRARLMPLEWRDVPASAKDTERHDG